MSTMNGGFRIHITYKSGDTYTFTRQEDSWVENGPANKASRPIDRSPERVLYHLLRALSRPSNVINVRVLESD